MRVQPFTASVEYAGASVRADFIRRTYQHLAWAVLGFIVVEALLPVGCCHEGVLPV